MPEHFHAIAAASGWYAMVETEDGDAVELDVVGWHYDGLHGWPIVLDPEHEVDHGGSGHYSSALAHGDKLEAATSLPWRLIAVTRDPKRWQQELDDLAAMLASGLPLVTPKDAA